MLLKIIKKIYILIIIAIRKMAAIFAADVMDIVN